jgi:hypothetical protein
MSRMLRGDASNSSGRTCMNWLDLVVYAIEEDTEKIRWILSCKPVRPCKMGKPTGSVQVKQLNQDVAVIGVATTKVEFYPIKFVVRKFSNQSIQLLPFRFVSNEYGLLTEDLIQLVEAKQKENPVEIIGNDGAG